jgi:hypothetical protein
MLSLLVPLQLILKQYQQISHTILHPTLARLSFGDLLHIFN